MRDLPRLREIAAILVSHGLGEFIQRIKLSKFIGKLTFGQTDKHAHAKYIPTAKRFRLAFEELVVA